MTDKPKYKRPNPIRRTGVFVGVYVNPELKRAIVEEAGRTTGGNVALCLAELLTEAIDARRDKEKDGK